MQISWRLAEHGWSDLDLWLGDKHQDFCVTHVFNLPMVEIADALLSLNRGDEKATFTIHEEPGRHVWTATRIPEQHHLLLVEIRSNDDNFYTLEPASDVTEFSVARDFFIESFLLELEKIAAQLRYPRFARDRDSEGFPWDTLRELRSHRSNRSEQGAARTDQAP